MNKRHTISFVGEARESFSMAMSAIAAHKLRSALTLLGVLVGVFSIIVVMTAMRVMEHDVEKQLSSLGTQTFRITKWPATQFGNSGDYEEYWRRKNITLDQARLLAEKTALARNIGIETGFGAWDVSTRYNKGVPSVRILGETPGSFGARNWDIQEGRLFVDSDVDSGRAVCIIGSSLATNLFPNSSPLGEQVKIDGINYTVIGIFERKGSASGSGLDDWVVIPVTTGMNRYGFRWRSLNLLVEARDHENYDATVDEVRGALRVIRKVPPGKKDDFEIASNDSMIKQFNNFTRNVRIGVAIVSSIALLAAGIGIMNIMLVSVTERTREIGIRRAIGAKRRNIMAQFIMEAIVLCEVGGVIGVFLGILGGNALAYFMKLAPVIPVDWVVIGLVICSVVGIVFGTYPAWKAANLDPIESLRYE